MCLQVTAVVEAVLGLPDGAKCLVFSQWDEMLSLVAKALDANGVAHRRLQGARSAACNPTSPSPSPRLP